MSECEYGDFYVYYLDIPTGLADGTWELSLSVGNNLVQFISYGGAITAVEGPAINTTSEDIGVEERAEDGANNSIALMPELGRSQTSFSETGEVSGSWEKGAVDNNTKGYANTEPYQVLPVELIYFKAKVTAQSVSLNWATATEINNQEFVIERSTNENLDFKAIGKTSGHGTTLEQQLYEFQDLKPAAGTSYYRLKQVDLDGTSTYSRIEAVTMRREVITTLALYPNPAAAFINVTLDLPAGGKEILVQIVDLKGRVMYRQLHKPVNKSKDLNIPLANLPDGNYYLVVMKDGKREAKAFLKR